MIYCLQLALPDDAAQLSVQGFPCSAFWLQCFPLHSCQSGVFLQRMLASLECPQALCQGSYCELRCIFGATHLDAQFSTSMIVQGKVLPRGRGSEAKVPSLLALRTVACELLTL